MNDTELSRSRKLAAKTVYAALQVLKQNDGELPGKEVISAVEKHVELDDWAKERYEKSGSVRWKSILHFFSIACVKAGFLVKKKGVWYLTPEGEEALKLGEIGLHKAANEAYRKWSRERDKIPDEEPSDEEEGASQKVTIDEIEQLAIEGLQRHILAKNPYEFQDLCAALLRGMGYYTPFVSPRGKDGGIDVIAYQDPLGTTSPRIKVQIKHRESSATVQEVRQLMGLLQKDGDVGIFVSAGGFTAAAKEAARSSAVHVELIDLPRLISLWQEFYRELSEEDKSLLPLVPVYFIAPAA